MRFDSLVTNAGRLRILVALAGQSRKTFVQLRQRTGLTDGNLATHARRLQRAGLLRIDKIFQHGKPVTFFELTGNGRDALSHHAQSLLAALQEPVEVVEALGAGVAHDDGDWID